jgi:hypothetical protein
MIDLRKNSVLLVPICGRLDAGTKMEMARRTLVGISACFSVSALSSYAHGDVPNPKGIARALAINSNGGKPFAF